MWWTADSASRLAGFDLSKKLENHKACFVLWVAWYNFVRVNSAIRMTPAMASGLTNTLWTTRDLL